MPTLDYPSWSVVWTVHTSGGFSAELPVKSWSITFNRREPIDWNINLPMIAALRPKGSVGRYLQPEPYDAAYTLRRWLTCVVTVGSDVYESPKLVLKTYAANIVKGNRVLQCTGGDRLEVLLEEDAVEDDIRSKAEAIVGCKAATTESLTARGITSVTQSYTDYNIKTHHRAGVPFEYLKELWKKFQGCLEWDGDTLIISPGGVLPSDLTADYTLAEDTNISVLGYEKDTNFGYNETTVEFPSELIHGVQPQIGKALGNVTVPLETPSFYAQVVIQLDDPGYTGDYTWDDEESNPITMAPTKTFTNPTTKAHRLRFNIYPPEGSGSLEEIRYRVWILIDNRPPEFGDYPDAPHVTVDSSFDKSKRGIKRNPQPFSMPQLATTADATDAATRQMNEDLMDYLTLQIKGPLVLGARANKVASVTASDLDLNERNFMTQTATWSGDDKKIEMTLNLSSNLTADDVTFDDDSEGYETDSAEDQIWGPAPFGE